MSLLDAKIVETILTPDGKGYLVQLRISDAPLEGDDETPLPASAAISLTLAVRVEGDDSVALALLQLKAINDADSALQSLIRGLKGKLRS